MNTITKSDLVDLGYAPNTAKSIIKEIKNLMIKKGHTYYQNKKLDRVPVQEVEHFLGISINNVTK